MSNQSRQPKGIPAGGQFAASARAEAAAPLPVSGRFDECSECGNEYIDDPLGSPGVLVHFDRNRDGSSYDLDADHAPVPGYVGL